jgi:glycosyltransferase involved in cell wall biosynthesis
LIPAHDEAKGILATLNDIKPQLRPTDRLLVVADNCTDDTLQLALKSPCDWNPLGIGLRVELSCAKRVRKIALVLMAGIKPNPGLRTPGACHTANS